MEDGGEGDGGGEGAASSTGMKESKKSDTKPAGFTQKEAANANASSGRAAPRARQS